MPSKQNIKAINEWQNANTELLRIRVRNVERLSERIQMAIDAGRGKSRQGYIIDAVKRALTEDGIPELPPREEDPARS